MIYTNEDINADSELILSESYDIHQTSTCHKSIVDDKISYAVSKTLAIKRLLSFSDSTIRTELENCSIENNLINDKNKFCGVNNDLNILQLNSHSEYWKWYESVLNQFPLTVNVVPELKKNFSNSDNSVKQLEKDVLRDQLLINGVIFKGADGALMGAVSLLTDTLHRVLSECKLKPIVNNLEQFCHAILRTASRTNSGGISYAALQHVLSAEKTVPYIIAPVSRLAPPLILRLSVDEILIDNDGIVASGADDTANNYISANSFSSSFRNLFDSRSRSTLLPKEFPNINFSYDLDNNCTNGIVNTTSLSHLGTPGSTHSWGIKCEIQSVTIFDLKPVQDEEITTAHNLIRVLYSNTVCMPIKLSNESREENYFVINSGNIEFSQYKCRG